MGMHVGRKEGHTSHARAGGIASTGSVVLSRDDLSKSGWALAKFSCNPPEIVKEIMHIGGETEPGSMCKRVLKGSLKSTKETPSTRDGKHHGAQLAQDSVPTLGGDVGGGVRES